MKYFATMLFLVGLIALLIAVIIRITLNIVNMKLELKFKVHSKKTDPNYVKPEFKPLTEEEIYDIHNKGKITPEEMVKEWEGFDLCAPGDAIGSASWRCRKFNNCHDCLVDYANLHDEYFSFFDNTLVFTKYNVEKDS